MLYLILLLLLLLAGGVFLVKGLRSRQLDDHPICARCGFDLVGKPHDSQVCSECGTDVTTPHAIRVGNRARRPCLIYFGASMLLVGLSWAGLLISGISSTTFVRYEPTWWLVHEMHSSDSGVRGQAIAELSRRITTGRLSKRQMSHIADDIVQLQADLSRTWDPAWGDLFRDADISGAVSAEQWKQFGQHVEKLSLKVRPKVTRGDPVIYSIQLTAARIGNRQRIMLEISHLILNIDGRQIRNGSGCGIQLSVRGGRFNDLLPVPCFLRLQIQTRQAHAESRLRCRSLYSWNEKGKTVRPQTHRDGSGLPIAARPPALRQHQP